MVAPNEEKHSPQGQGAWKQESGPGQGRPSHGLTHLTECEQKNEDSGQMVIEFGIGDAFDRAFPGCLRRGPMMMLLSVGMGRPAVLDMLSLRRGDAPYDDETQEPHEPHPRPRESRTGKRSRE